MLNDCIKKYELHPQITANAQIVNASNARQRTKLKKCNYGTWQPLLSLNYDDSTSTNNSPLSDVPKDTSNNVHKLCDLCKTIIVKSKIKPIP